MLLRILATTTLLSAVGGLTMPAAIHETSAPAVPMAASDTVTVVRSQLEVQTCNKTDTKTDDPVSGAINGAQVTWLDYARDDFERNKTYTYDLGLTGVSKVADISQLRIYKQGSNGLCIYRVRLLINGAAIYSQTWSSGRWLDNSAADRTLLISSASLRSTASWSSFNTGPLAYFAANSFALSRTELESRIESMVGTAIHGNPLYWGHLNGRAVEVSRKDNNTVHVDVDLALDVNNWWDPAVDLDFDITLCEGGVFSPKVRNRKVDVDSKWYSEVLSFGIVELVDHKADAFIMKAIKGLKAPPVAGVPVCPTVKSDGSVAFL
jgi:hypothetical protein